MESESPDPNRVPLTPQQPANTVININIEVYQDGRSTTLYQVPQATGRSGPPPSYEEANDPAIAPPPSYDSLYGRVQEIKNSSNGFLDFLKNLFIVLLGTIGCTIMIAITVIVPFSMIVIGSLYVDECPTENNIPVYLIVGGILSLLRQMLALKIRFQRSRNPEQGSSNITESLQSLISCFLLGWFITGCFWVYRTFEPDYFNVSSTNYCHPILYTFAFWLLTSTYIIIGLFIVCLCCVSGTAILISVD